MCTNKPFSSQSTCRTAHAGNRKEIYKIFFLFKSANKPLNERDTRKEIKEKTEDTKTWQISEAILKSGGKSKQALVKA